MNPSENRELGVLGAKLQALEDKFEEHRQETRENRADVKKQFEKIDGTLQKVLDRINGWQGGWKAMTIVATAASALTGLVLQILPFITPHK
jgi:hypothetical protein